MAKRKRESARGRREKQRARAAKSRSRKDEPTNGKDTKGKGTDITHLWEPGGPGFDEDTLAAALGASAGRVPLPGGTPRVPKPKVTAPKPRRAGVLDTVLESVRPAPKPRRAAGVAPPNMPNVDIFNQSFPPPFIGNRMKSGGSVGVKGRDGLATRGLTKGRQI